MQQLLHILGQLHSLQGSVAARSEPCPHQPLGNMCLPPQVAGGARGRKGHFQPRCIMCWQPAQQQSDVSRHWVWDSEEASCWQGAGAGQCHARGAMAALQAGWVSCAQAAAPARHTPNLDCSSACVLVHFPPMETGMLIQSWQQVCSMCLCQSKFGAIWIALTLQVQRDAWIRWQGDVQRRQHRPLPGCCHSQAQGNC